MDRTQNASAVRRGPSGSPFTAATSTVNPAFGSNVAFTFGGLSNPTATAQRIPAANLAAAPTAEHLPAGPDLLASFNLHLASLLDFYDLPPGSWDDWDVGSIKTFAPQTRKRRRDEPLIDSYELSAHGRVLPNIRQLPGGKRVVMLNPLGTPQYLDMSKVLTNSENVKRLQERGVLTLGGKNGKKHDVYSVVYDKHNPWYPDMELTIGNLKEEAGRHVLPRKAKALPQARFDREKQTLSQYLNDKGTPDGTYFVTACRGLEGCRSMESSIRQMERLARLPRDPSIENSWTRATGPQPSKYSVAESSFRRTLKEATALIDDASSSKPLHRSRSLADQVARHQQSEKTRVAQSLGRMLNPSQSSSQAGSIGRTTAGSNGSAGSGRSGSADHAGVASAGSAGSAAQRRANMGKTTRASQKVAISRHRSRACTRAPRGTSAAPSGRAGPRPPTKSGARPGCRRGVSL